MRVSWLRWSGRSFVCGLSVALVAVLLPMLVSSGSAATGVTEYFVAPSGSDAWPGSRTKPFATLARAQAAARAAAPWAAGDIVINVRRGTYRLDQPLELTDADSGRNGHRVIYQAYGYGTSGQEEAVISGGRTVTGWILDDARKNIWKADVGNLEPRQLYVNGQRAPRASFRNTVTMVESPTGYTVTDGSYSIASWSSPADIEAVWVRDAVSWAAPRCGVSAIVFPGEIVMDQPCFSRMIGSAYVGSNPTRKPTSFEYSRSFLADPGTQVLETSVPGHHMLYYIPRAGEDMRTAEVVAPVLERLVDATGTPAAPVHDITVRGLTFAHATWNRPSTSEGFVHHLSEQWWCGDPTIYPEGEICHVPGNLKFHYADRITLQDNRFEHLGATAVEMAGSDNVVSGNVITDTSSGGVLVGNAQPETRDSVSNNDRIENNWIHDIGREYAGGTGITAIQANGVVIAHNQINGLPDRGIFVCGVTPTCQGPGIQGAQVLDNLIFDVMRVMGDGGGIYAVATQGTSYETGALLKGNVIHDTDYEPDVHPGPTNAPLDFALYTDFGAKWITLSDNVVYNTTY